SFSSPRRLSPPLSPSSSPRAAAATPVAPRRGPGSTGGGADERWHPLAVRATLGLGAPTRETACSRQPQQRAALRQTASVPGGRSRTSSPLASARAGRRIPPPDPVPSDVLLGSPDPDASRSTSTVSSEWQLVRKVGAV
ncbi:unnamed protein product, partial [Urochloa humidicola]